jgi:hypothetical protein
LPVGLTKRLEAASLRIQPASKQSIEKILAPLAVELVATGKMAKTKSGDLIGILASDLTGTPIDLVQSALRQHKRKSPFWPAVSDLMKFIDESLAARHAEQKLADQERELFITRQSEEPEQTQAERSDAVKRIMSETKFKRVSE